MKITQQLLLVLIALVALTTFSCSSDNEAPIDTNNNTVISQDAITLACDINDDTTLTNHAEGVDYIVECNVDVKALLTIEPGTTIVFKSDKSIYVDIGGALSAIGTSSNQITFKGEEALSGYWKGIGFKSADVRNELNHVNINDTGSNAVLYDIKAAIAVYDGSVDAKLTLKNSKIQNTNGIGLVIESDADLREFSNNTFTNNTEQAIKLSANHASKIDANSIFTNNGFDGVTIRRSNLNIGSEHVWQGINYLVEGKINVEVGLKLNAGTNLKFTTNGYLFIDESNAYINAIGTASNNINISGETSLSGSWRGIGIHSSNPLNQFRYCNLKYGGSDEIHGWVNRKGIIILYDASGVTSKLRVENCNISDSDGDGIIIHDMSTLIQSNNTFSNIAGNDIYYY